MEKENGLLAETEEYLRQYGYTPMATSLVESEVGGGDANGGEIIIQKTSMAPESSDNLTSVARKNRIIWHNQIR